MNFLFKKCVFFFNFIGRQTKKTDFSFLNFITEIKEESHKNQLLVDGRTSFSLLINSKEI